MSSGCYQVRFYNVRLNKFLPSQPLPNFRNEILAGTEQERLKEAFQRCQHNNGHIPIRKGGVPPYELKDDKGRILVEPFKPTKRR